MVGFEMCDIQVLDTVLIGGDDALKSVVLDFHANDGQC